MALSKLALALLVVGLFSDVARASTSPRVLLFSDSDALFRPQLAEEGSVSPLGLVAASAALLGLPSPPGTDAALAKQVNELIAPNPFFHAKWMLLLTVSSAPDLPAGWMQGMKLGSAEEAGAIQLEQHRQLDATTGANPLVALRKALGALQRDTGSNLRVFPGSASTLPQTDADQDGAWDAAVLGGLSLGSMEAHSASSLRSSSAQVGEEFIQSVLRAAKWVEESAAASVEASSPALIEASISLKGLSGNTQHALEAALAVILGSVAKSKKASGPVAVAAILESGETVEGGLLQPSIAAGMETSERGRVLQGVAEPVTPEEVVSKSVLFVVVLVLLVAILLGLWLLFGMPVTKDTLLYSGAKID